MLPPASEHPGYEPHLRLPRGPCPAWGSHSPEGGGGGHSGCWVEGSAGWKAGGGCGGGAFGLVMELALSFTLRDFSFPFDLLQFMKNRTHVFLINFYKITEMLTFSKSHFIWRLLLDSFKTSFEFGQKQGDPATPSLPSTWQQVALSQRRVLVGRRPWSSPPHAPSSLAPQGPRDKVWAP